MWCCRPPPWKKPARLRIPKACPACPPGHRASGRQPSRLGDPFRPFGPVGHAIGVRRCKDSSKRSEPHSRLWASRPGTGATEGGSGRDRTAISEWAIAKTWRRTLYLGCPVTTGRGIRAIGAGSKPVSLGETFDPLERTGPIEGTGHAADQPGRMRPVWCLADGDRVRLSNARGEMTTTVKIVGRVPEGSPGSRITSANRRFICLIAPTISFTRSDAQLQNEIRGVR